MDRNHFEFRDTTQKISLDVHNISRYMDDSDTDPIMKQVQQARQSPSWLQGPRDHTTLPDIINSTYSDYTAEADYAMKQMLAILETLNPVENYLELFEKSIQAINFRLPKPDVEKDGKVDWNAVRTKLANEAASSTSSNHEDEPATLTTAQISSIFDAFPFLLEVVVCHEELHKLKDVFSMLLMVTMCGNSAVRRQCISAISNTISLQRNLISQDVLCDGIIPGLFSIYQSGVSAFQSNDLRMDCVQALCRVIPCNTIHDRQWLFEKFVPPFSHMLKDPTMHVRKTALHIFIDLGQMFGEKFTEVFLVPHLINLSSDMTWAVRKEACEVYVKVTECASNEVRVKELSPNFIRLLKDNNKWVSFVAYQQLGPFISSFADPSVTGLELLNGQVVVTSPNEVSVSETIGKDTVVVKSSDEEFGCLPPQTYLPDPLDNYDSKREELEHVLKTSSVAEAKTPKRGERVMDSVLSGINKMFGPFERSSPKTSTPKEIEKVSATFSSPSKRSTISLHSAVSLMDKWSKRNNPNNPQRFPIFDSSNHSSPNDPTALEDQRSDASIGIAAKCSSTDDLTKLGLDDEDEAAVSSSSSSSASTAQHPESAADKRTSSPRGRRIANNAWEKLDIRQKLFLRRLGALPPSSSTKSPKSPKSPRCSSPRSVVCRKTKKMAKMVFDFAEPAEICATPPLPPHQKSLAVGEGDEEVERDELNTVEREQYMENATPRFNDDEADSDEEEEGLDKSFVADEQDDDEDAPLTMQIKSATAVPESVSVSVSAIREEPISNEFSLTYWSSNYAISSIDDELKPFGSSSSFSDSPTSNTYLESRFDVMKTSTTTSTSPRTRSASFGAKSPQTTSPRRKANSVSESSPPCTAEASKSCESEAMLNTEEKEKLGILDFDELDMSMSSNSSTVGDPIDDDLNTTFTSCERAAVRHVPSELVDLYMKVMVQGTTPVAVTGRDSPGNGSSVATDDSSLCAEIYRQCAHNFPAVCYTLGRAAWPRLKSVFRKLALDEQVRVRQAIAYSIHEIAHMFGPEITDEDLLPVFYDLRNDQNSDVRNGILLHLYDFVKCLSPEKRDEMILSLPQFFPIGAQPGNQAQNGDWRSRFELISQLAKLCTLYSIQDVNLHMSGIALTLADDRVAEVRREAVSLVSIIVGALVSAEWTDIRETRDTETGCADTKGRKDSFLSEQFVNDIVSSFAKTQKWTRRQTFCFICAQILRDKQCDGIQFRYFFATPLQQLVNDKVPNVRLASCEALSMWRKTLIAIRAQEKRGQSPTSSPSSEPSSIRRDINLVSDMMVRLSNDSDIDAAFLAKKCQGLTDDEQPVDVEARTMRMREREELYFGDVILEDSNGTVVRIVSKEIKQIVKLGKTQVEESKPIEIVKEAPLQSLEEFDDELLNAVEEMMVTPPEMTAVFSRVVEQEADPLLKDNTEEVDMDIEEDDNSPQREPVKETTNDEEETDIPMDPTPSHSEKSPESASPINLQNESDA